MTEDNTATPEAAVGDIVKLRWVARYQHGATMTVIKVNAKSLICIENERSYGAGRRWSIHKDSKYTLVKTGDQTND